MSFLRRLEKGTKISPLNSSIRFLLSYESAQLCSSKNIIIQAFGVHIGV